jgi:hypothetical protein
MDNVGMASALFGFLAVGAVALFTMISVAVWSESRRKERESYYKNDMLKKVAEATQPGANAALDLLHAESRIATARTQQGLKIGGLVLSAVGIGLLVFLRALIRDEPIFLVGFMVFLMGAALFGGSYLVTNPVE